MTRRLIKQLQWSLSIVDTTGPRKCVLIREVDLYTQKYSIGDLRNCPS